MSLFGRWRPKLCRWRQVFVVDDFFLKSSYSNTRLDLQTNALPAIKFFFVTCLILTRITLFAQSSEDSIFSKIDPQKFILAIEKKTSQLEECLIQKSLRTLDRLQKQEEKMYRKMLKGEDSLTAKAALSEIKERYEGFKKSIASSLNPEAGSNYYLPKLDTLSTALKFLDQRGINGNLKNAIDKTKSLQGRFQRAEELKQFIKERSNRLKEQFGLTKSLKRFKKELYYYNEQLNEYKSLLTDSKKRERKMLDLLSRTKPFKDFMRRNSLFASMFRLPAQPGDPVNLNGLAGLQTSAQVNNLILQQISSGGADAQQQFRQNMQEAQSKMSELKNRIAQHGNNDADMPEGFRPNNQKVKRFRERLEYGANVQTQKGNNFFPVTSDIALSLGYKLNDRSVIGMAASFKIGWGKNWSSMRISTEGLGIRSFIDWKLKGSFWLSGGYEQNYKSSFRSIQQLRNYSAWQASGLIGISKIVSLKTKFFKNTRVQVLWDFLSYRNVPVTQPLIFRVGYNF